MMMSTTPPEPPGPPRDLRAHRRRTERWLAIGFVVILLLIGGGAIAWAYGYGGLAGGLVCILPILGLAGLLWLLLTWAGRWASGD